LVIVFGDEFAETFIQGLASPLAHEQILVVRFRKIRRLQESLIIAQSWIDIGAKRMLSRERRDRGDTASPNVRCLWLLRPTNGSGNCDRDDHWNGFQYVHTLWVNNASD
jgi:hypothetical protein